MIVDNKTKKFLMVVISFVLTFVLLFCLVSRPFKVHALATETALLMVIASICLSMGISLTVEMVTDEQNITWFRGCLESLSQQALDDLNKAAAAVSASYLIFYNWQASSYQRLCNEIYDYFASQQQASGDTAFGTIYTSNDNNLLGFTPGTAFNIYYPADTRAAIYTLPAGTLKIFDRAQASDFSGTMFSRCFTSHSAAEICSSGNRWGYILSSSDGLCYFKLAGGYNNVHFYSQTWSLKSESRDMNSYYQSNITGYGAAFSILQLNFEPDVSGYSWTAYGYVDQQGNTYKIANSGTSDYYFQDLNNSSHIYNDLHFNSNQQAIDWFRSQCGFFTSSYGDVGSYSPVDDLAGLDFDITEVSQNVAEINAIETDTIVSTLPGSIAQEQALADTPSAVLDQDIAKTLDIPYLTADIPSISAPAALWTTKFPFCLPWDISNLVSSFSGEAEAPVFHLLIMPENSFGIQNDDIYLDIDFADYDVLVKILRFFISVEFVLALILITRKITGSGGG